MQLGEPVANGQKPIRFVDQLIESGAIDKNQSF